MFHYICSFIDDESTHKEIRHKVFGWGFFCFCAFMVIGMFASLICGGIYGISINNTTLATYSLVMSAAFIIPCIQLVCFFIKFFHSKHEPKNVTLAFLDDHIEINKQTQYVYGHIKKIAQTKNYLIIFIQETNKPYIYIPVKKDSLNCNPGTLITFLRQKRKESKQEFFMPAH